MPQQMRCYDNAHSAFPHIYGVSVAEYFTESSHLLLKSFTVYSVSQKQYTLKLSANISLCCVKINKRLKNKRSCIHLIPILLFSRNHSFKVPPNFIPKPLLRYSNHPVISLTAVNHSVELFDIYIICYV